MAMTSDKWRGAWAGTVAPSVLPGLREGQPNGTAYVDENGQAWLVEAYDPSAGATPFAASTTYKWHATLTSPANVYGEDSSAPTIAGSESEFAAVAGIDVYAAAWKRAHIPATVPAKPEGGGAVLWLVILVAFAMSDGKKRR